jgi:hypothetical protein
MLTWLISFIFAWIIAFIFKWDMFQLLVFAALYAIFLTLKEIKSKL